MTDIPDHMEDNENSGDIFSDTDNTDSDNGNV